MSLHMRMNANLKPTFPICIHMTVSQIKICWKILESATAILIVCAIYAIFYFVKKKDFCAKSTPALNGLHVQFTVPSLRKYSCNYSIQKKLPISLKLLQFILRFRKNRIIVFICKCKPRVFICFSNKNYSLKFVNAKIYNIDTGSNEKILIFQCYLFIWAVIIFYFLKI